MKLEAEHKVAQLTDDISVLVVDDNEINLMLMEDILDVMDIKKVKTLESGIEAIKEIENNPNYDVVVMDICMPVMDGYEASKQLRKIGYEGRIIALTANQLSKDDSKFQEAMMDDILLKPVDLMMIQKVLGC
ncbi:MAG: response regulator [Turicibacter sp.]|nr:response regulator [Turicibacter sp.]